MEFILSLDQQLFLLLNHLPHTSLSDVVALAISGVGTAGVIWFVLATVLFLKEEKKDHWFFIISGFERIMSAGPSPFSRKVRGFKILGG